MKTAFYGGPKNGEWMVVKPEQQHIAIAERPDITMLEFRQLPSGPPLATPVKVHRYVRKKVFDNPLPYITRSASLFVLDQCQDDELPPEIAHAVVRWSPYTWRRPSFLCNFDAWWDWTCHALGVLPKTNRVLAEQLDMLRRSDRVKIIQVIE